MEPDRREKLLRAVELVKMLDDRETDVAKLVAQAMQTGYDMAKLEPRRA